MRATTTLAQGAGNIGYTFVSTVSYSPHRLTSLGSNTLLREW